MGLDSIEENFNCLDNWERVRTLTTIGKLEGRNDDWVWMFSCQCEVQRVVQLDVESPEFSIRVIYIEG